MKIKRPRRRLLLAAAGLFAALLLTVTGTYAWLNREQEVDEVYTALSDFEVEGILSFGGEVYTGNSVMVPVSFLAGNDSYIGKLKYSVRYRGISPACLRVRVLEQWVDSGTNEVLSASYLNYALSDIVSELKPDGTPVQYPAVGSGGEIEPLAKMGKWVDNRAADYCYYYSVPVQPKQLPIVQTDGILSGIQDGAVELTLIDQTVAGAGTEQMIEGIDPNSTELMLLFEVEAVQPNRLREFFHIDRLPEPSATVLPDTE